MHEKRQIDKNNLNIFMKNQESKVESQAVTNSLKDVMNRYDIKHPLRGEA
jgi:hypothetical protein